VLRLSVQDDTAGAYQLVSCVLSVRLLFHTNVFCECSAILHVIADQVCRRAGLGHRAVAIRGVTTADAGRGYAAAETDRIYFVQTAACQELSARYRAHDMLDGSGYSTGRCNLATRAKAHRRFTGLNHGLVHPAKPFHGRGRTVGPTRRRVIWGVRMTPP
jgi:hypothetical protein